MCGMMDDELEDEDIMKEVAKAKKTRPLKTYINHEERLPRMLGPEIMVVHSGSLLPCQRAVDL